MKRVGIMTTNPVAGWYAAPDKPGVLRFWDGTAWTDQEKPAPGPAPEPPSGAPVEAAPAAPPTKFETATKIAGATGFAAAGAALVADGSVGLGKNRKGVKGLTKYFVWGAILFMIGFVAVLSGISMAISGSTEDSPLLGGLVVIFIGVLVFVIGSFKLALRAGSIIGGLYLLREGWKRGKKIETPDA